MGKFQKILLGISVLLILVVLFLVMGNQSQLYLFYSFVILLLAMAPFFIQFEKKKVDTREIVLIALLAAIAAVGRIPFAAIPSVQPTSFVIMMTGFVFGPHTGFMVGVTSALVSNIFLGQGPWTPWQMFGWGMMGLTAGLLKNTWILKYKIGKIVFGFIWGFLFGWIMNLWHIIGFFSETISPSLILVSIGTSFFFDLLHALSNVFFLAVFSSSWSKILNRFKMKISGIVKVHG